MKRGDRVVTVADPSIPRSVAGRVFIVEKVNPKNVICRAEDGGRGINYPKTLLTAATDDALAASSAPRPFVPVEHFEVGTIVTLTRPYRDWTTETPLVVIGGRGDKVNVTLIGGDHDRYVRVPARSGLVRRDLAWLAERLLDEATR